MTSTQKSRTTKARLSRSIGLSALILAVSGGVAFAQAVVVHGNQRVDAETIRSYAVGRENPQEIRESLLATGMFSSVQVSQRGAQTVIPHMPPAGGAIVNLASVSGSRADAKLLAYTTSKSAVVNLTREIALDCARRGTNIRCNSVSPGVVDTAMIESFFGSGVDATLPEWIDTQPLRRAIAPSEVADIIVFLAGSDSTFVTGADFPIDCGATA